MADQIEPFTVTCAANTAISAAVEQMVTFDPAEVERIEVDIPRGHAGLTGIRLAIAHQVVIPYQSSGWLIGNANHYSFETSKYPHSGQWSAFMYNTDNRSHQWLLVFHLHGIEYPREPLNYVPIAVTDIYQTVEDDYV